MADESPFDLFADLEKTAPSPGSGDETTAADFIGAEIPNSPNPIFDWETGPAWMSESIIDAKKFCEPLGIVFDPSSLGEHPGLTPWWRQGGAASLDP